MKSGRIERRKPFSLELQKVVMKNGREEDRHRLRQRQRQIDYGKNTVGYQRYMEMIPMEKRTKDHPWTPMKEQKCSKRSWDGQIRKWRKLLHCYDPPEESRESCEDEEACEGGNDVLLDDDGLPIERVLGDVPGEKEEKMGLQAPREDAIARSIYEAFEA